jgi:hypothetical protein
LPDCVSDDNIARDSQHSLPLLLCHTAFNSQRTTVESKHLLASLVRPYLYCISTLPILDPPPKNEYADYDQEWTDFGIGIILAII